MAGPQRFIAAAHHGIAGAFFHQGLERVVTVNHPEWVYARLMQYERQKKTCTSLISLSGGLLVVLGLGGTRLSHAAWQVTSLSITSVVLAVLGLGCAYLMAQEADEDLRMTMRRVEQTEASFQIIDPRRDRKSLAMLFAAGLACLGIAVVAMVAGLWWPGG